MKLKKIISALILCGVIQQCLHAADKEKAANQPTTPPPAKTKSGPTLIASPRDACDKGLITEYQYRQVLDGQRLLFLHQNVNSKPK